MLFLQNTRFCGNLGLYFFKIFFGSFCFRNKKILYHTLSDDSCHGVTYGSPSDWVPVLHNIPAARLSGYSALCLKADAVGKISGQAEASYVGNDAGQGA